MINETNRKKVRLVWLDINSSYSHSSLALPAIQAQQEKYGDNCDIEWIKVSGTINSPISSIVSDLVDAKPDVIAYTAWLFTHEVVIKILSRFKTLCPETVVIGGGPEYMGCNRQILKTYSFINVVFRGEGEEQFYKWLNLWSSPDMWSAVKGLSYYDSHGCYHDYGIARVEDYSSLKAPETSPFFDWSKPFIQIESTRGCFNSCAFCVSGADKPVRSIPVSMLRERLIEAEKHGIRDIRLLDRTFNGTGKRAIELLDLFEEFAGRLQFHLEVHPALFTEAIRERMRLLPKGLLHIEAGVQSLNNEVLTTAQRHGAVEAVVDGLKFLCSLGTMEIHSDLIAGLPHYTLEQIYKDVYELSSIGCSEIQLELLKLLPGTVMRNKSNILGLRFAHLPPYEVMQSNVMSYSELQEARRLSRMIDMYYNCNVWQKVIQELIASDCNFARRFTLHLTDIDMIEQPLSMERRGLILYDFCKVYYPSSLITLTLCWIDGGLTMKKGACEGTVTYNGELPSDFSIIKGEYNDKLRLYIKSLNECDIIFGYNRTEQHSSPMMIAMKK